MLRLTELRLPIDHDAAALRAAVLKRLSLSDKDLVSLTVFKRAADARKPKAIVWTYTLDLEVANEVGVLKRLKGDRNLSPSPDMAYRHERHLEAAPRKRPVVIGAGPCGYFAALILAEMGFRPIVLERGKVVRERTKDTFGFWR